MKHLRARLTVLSIIVSLTIPAISAGISFAADDTFTQLEAVFKSCEKVEASKNISLPFYEESISVVKAEIEFLRRMERVSQTCLLSLGGFSMSHGAAFLNRYQEEAMLQSSKRAVTSSSRKVFYDMSRECRGIAEDALREAAKNLEEAYKNCFPDT